MKDTLSIKQVRNALKSVIGANWGSVVYRYNDKRRNGRRIKFYSNYASEADWDKVKEILSLDESWYIARVPYDTPYGKFATVYMAKQFKL